MVASGAALASSNCFGSDNMRTCTDRHGNSYQVHKFGNTTQVYGTNPQTGSSWSQTSQTYGNTTHHSGTAANGQNWNSTTQRMGNNSHTYGTDSRGRSFSQTCNQFGCF